MNVLEDIVNLWTTPLEEIAESMGTIPGNITQRDQRHVGWVIGVLQARVAVEAARSQERTTAALVRATNRLGWFTLALVVATAIAGVAAAVSLFSA